MVIIYRNIYRRTCHIFVYFRFSCRNFDGHFHTQRAVVTGQLRVYGKERHLRRCTLEDQSLDLKRKHRVHKYVNTATICVSVTNLFILT